METVIGRSQRSLILFFALAQAAAADAVINNPELLTETDTVITFGDETLLGLPDSVTYEGVVFHTFRSDNVTSSSPLGFDLVERTTDPPLPHHVNYNYVRRAALSRAGTAVDQVAITFPTNQSQVSLDFFFVIHDGVKLEAYDEDLQLLEVVDVPTTSWDVSVGITRDIADIKGLRIYAGESGLRGTDWFQWDGIDNVRFRAAAPVPEPTAFLFLLAIGAVASSRRWRLRS